MVAEVQPFLDESKTSTLTIFADLLAYFIYNSSSAFRDVSSQCEHQLRVIYELRTGLIEDFEDVVTLGCGDIDSLLLDDSLELFVGEKAVSISVCASQSLLEEQESFGSLGGESLLDPQDDRLNLSHFLSAHFLHL